MSAVTRVIRPISPALLRRLFFLASGIAFAAVLIATASQFELRRECKGAFSRGFSAGFDRHRCSLNIGHLPTRAELKILLF
jgi:hypothetical protein